MFLPRNEALRRVPDNSTSKKTIADRTEGLAPQQVRISVPGVSDFHMSCRGQMRRISDLTDEDLVEHFNECTKVINQQRSKPLPMVPYKAPEQPQERDNRTGAAAIGSQKDFR